jgi:hypothetical protein
MITTDGIEITRETARYKFGGDPFAEYLWNVSLHATPDEESGDVEASCGWFARIGRHILRSDSQGFVWRESYPSVGEAMAQFSELSSEYHEWDDEDEESEDDSDSDTLTDGQVRRIASEWHGGQFTPLYKLSSTGTITDDVADEIVALLMPNLGEQEASRRELQALLDYVTEHGPRGPREGWSGLWDDTPVGQDEESDDDGVIRAEIGTTGEEYDLTLTSERLDVAEAIEVEHDCDDFASCDIYNAMAQGYVWAAAHLLHGATETPLLDAVLEHYGSDVRPDAHFDEWVGWM